MNWRNVVAFLTLAVAAAFTFYIVVSGKTFWDFAVYRAGVAAYRAIGTPYNPEYLRQAFGLGLPFTYAPMVLLAFARLSWLLTSGPGLALLLAAHVAACALIPWLMVPPALRRTELLWMTGVFLTAFGLSGTKLFLTGNLAAVASALVLVALRYCIPRRNYTVLFLVLLLVCQVKIYFICFWAVPFLMDRKVWAPAAACVLIIATYALNYLMPPLLVHGFVTSLQAVSQVTAFVGTSVLTAVQISSGRLATHNGSLAVAIAWGVHCLYAVLLLGFGARVMWTRARPDASPHLASAWAFMAAMLISPRLAPYELALLVIPFLLFLQQLLAARDVGLGVAIAGFIAGASLVTTPLADWGGFVALLGVWVGMGVTWLRAAARRERAPLVVTAAA